MIMLLLLHSHLPHTVRVLPFPSEAQNTANKYVQFCGKRGKEEEEEMAKNVSPVEICLCRYKQCCTLMHNDYISCNITTTHG